MNHQGLNDDDHQMSIRDFVTFFQYLIIKMKWISFDSHFPTTSLNRIKTGEFFSNINPFLRPSRIWYRIKSTLHSKKFCKIPWTKNQSSKFRINNFFSSYPSVANPHRCLFVDRSCLSFNHVSTLWRTSENVGAVSTWCYKIHSFIPVMWLSIHTCWIPVNSVQKFDKIGFIVGRQ